MITISIISGLIAILLACICLVGGYRMVRAAQSGDWPLVKGLAWAELRLGLNLAGACIIVATQGRGVRTAQILLLVSFVTKLPESLRALSGNSESTSNSESTRQGDSQGE